jgi:phosphatidylglycerol---prolipoprotein diacylglyceryl transferase
VHPLLFQVGPIAVPSYGVLAAIGVLAALFLSVRLARVLSVDPDKIWNLGVLMVFSSLVGSRLLLVLLHWGDFRAAPLWMVGLASMNTPWLLLGGCAVGLLTGLAYALIAKLPLRRTLDVLAAPLALGHALSCMGSLAAGSAYGTPTTLPWAVVYNSRLAMLWSRTPQGLPLHPTQLYECLVELAIFCLLLVLLRRVAPGEVMGTWLILFGISRYFLDFLRGGDARILNGWLTLGQTLALLMVVAGGVLWWKRDTLEDSAHIA